MTLQFAQGPSTPQSSRLKLSRWIWFNASLRAARDMLKCLRPAQTAVIRMPREIECNYRCLSSLAAATGWGHKQTLRTELATSCPTEHAQGVYNNCSPPLLGATRACLLYRCTTRAVDPASAGQTASRSGKCLTTCQPTVASLQTQVGV